MADFNKIHGKAIDAARGRVRSGEMWSIALREPVQMLERPTRAMPEISVTILVFRAMADGRLEPARDFDRQKIADWKTKHRHTPPESFGLLEGFLARDRPS